MEALKFPSNHVSMVQFTNHLLPATGGNSSRPGGATSSLKLGSLVSAVSLHSLQNFHRYANILRPARGGWGRGLSHIRPKKWLNLQISKHRYMSHPQRLYLLGYTHVVPLSGHLGPLERPFAIIGRHHLISWLSPPSLLLPRLVLSEVFVQIPELPLFWPFLCSLR